jgi:APA family basic amino acid/polyamine antiporter
MSIYHKEQDHMPNSTDSGGNNGTKVRREMGLFTATSIVVANMVGAGIFTATGIISGFLPGPGWALGCWAFGGLIAMAGALCYAELATRMPDEGGEYFYLSRLYHPSLGFLTGWTSFFVGFSAPIAASAMGFSEYIFAGLNGRFELADPATLLVMKKGSAAAVIVIFTGLHYFGLRKGGKVQNVLTTVKVLIVAGLAATGIVLGGGAGWSPGDGMNSGGLLAVGTAMMLVMFSYSGWNATSYVAGEVRDPRRTLPLSLVAGTGIVIVLYMAVNLFIFRALPYSEVRGTIAIVEKASVSTFGEWMGRGLSIMVGIALLSSLSAYIIIGPRVYFAMARDRLFLPFAARVNPRYGVPGRSIAIQGVLAVGMVVAGSFEQLLVYIGFALGIFPWLAVAGLFIARKRSTGESGAAKVPLYPFLPVFFLVTTLLLMVVAFINRPIESSAALVTVAAGVPVYYLWVRAVDRNGR